VIARIRRQLAEGVITAHLEIQAQYRGYAPTDRWVPCSKPGTEQTSGHFTVVPLTPGYHIVWESEDEIPLAYEWDKVYTGTSGQSNAYRRARQLNKLVEIQAALFQMGGAWWAGPYKSGKGKGEYVILPKKQIQDELLGFSSLEQLSAWIKEQSVNEKDEVSR
jgi:hypothetical protein